MITNQPISRSARRQRLLKRMTIANAALLAVVYLLENLVAERHWSTALLAYAPSALYLIPLAALTTWALLTRQWRMLGANALAIVLAVPTLTGFNIPLEATRLSSANPVRVMTYNIRHGDKGVQAIWAAVAAQKPDIVCLQEVAPQGKWPDPTAGLLNSIPRDWHTVHGDELLIASRYPIESSILHRPEGTGEFAVLEAIVNANGRKLTVYTTHLSAITPFGLLTCWRNHAQLQYVQQTMRRRSLQTDWIIARLRNTTGPVVLAGDFNIPPRGLLYQRLVSQMQDSFRAAGWGPGLTFRTDLPLWRIDYVFADRKTSVMRCRVLGIAASNHMPVVADLVPWRQTSEGRSSASK